MRSEEEILEAFKDLQNPPGSRQPRRSEGTPTPSKKKTSVSDELPWDSNPTKKVLNGKEVEFFTVGALAIALGKEIVTLRMWERKGYIPTAPFRLRSKTLNGQKVKGNRAYTRELIEIVIDEFTRRGLLGTSRIEWKQHGDLPTAIKRRWKEALDQK